MFLDEFLRLGLIQCVSAPTHIKENILDIILSIWLQHLFGFVALSVFSGCSLISHELFDKTYIYANHQNDLNKGIKMMCFIFRFSIYFLRNQRKCSQNGEDGNLKI